MAVSKWALSPFKMLNVWLMGKGSRGGRPPWASPPSQGLCPEPCLSHPDKGENEHHTAGLEAPAPGPSGLSSQLPLVSPWSLPCSPATPFFQTKPAVDATSTTAPSPCKGKEAHCFLPNSSSHDTAEVESLTDHGLPHHWGSHNLLGTVLRHSAYRPPSPLHPTSSKYHPRFAGEEAKVQKGKATSPKPRG